MPNNPALRSPQPVSVKPARTTASEGLVAVGDTGHSIPVAHVVLGHFPTTAAAKDPLRKHKETLQRIKLHHMRNLNPNEVQPIPSLTVKHSLLFTNHALEEHSKNRMSQDLVLQDTVSMSSCPRPAKSDNHGTAWLSLLKGFWMF